MECKARGAQASHRICPQSGATNVKTSREWGRQLKIDIMLRNVATFNSVLKGLESIAVPLGGRQYYIRRCQENLKVSMNQEIWSMLKTDFTYCNSENSARSLDKLNLLHWSASHLCIFFETRIAIIIVRLPKDTQQTTPKLMFLVDLFIIIKPGILILRFYQAFDFGSSIKHLISIKSLCFGWNFNVNKNPWL